MDHGEMDGLRGVTYIDLGQNSGAVVLSSLAPNGHLHSDFLDGLSGDNVKERLTFAWRQRLQSMITTTASVGRRPQQKFASAIVADRQVI
ncbi:MAG: hypothetical protein WC809_02985 [Sinimarinibacterium sp.]